MRFGRSLQAFLLAAVFTALVPRAALALDYFDGRLQIHGFYEAQIRAISRDFSDDLDLTQWYNILNVEIEGDIVPDGWGPFDLVQAFGRVEVRYDCVWTHACSLFDSANTYGHRSISGRLPERMADGKRDGFTANMLTGDTRRYSNVQFFSVSCPEPSSPPSQSDRDCQRLRQATVLDGPAGGFQPIRIWQQRAFTRQFGTSPGVDGRFDGPDFPLCPLPALVACGSFFGQPPTFTDDPGFNVMRSVKDCFYGSQKTGGPTNGQGIRDLLLSIDDCRNRNASVGLLRDIPNPFRGAVDPSGTVRPDGGDINPWLGIDFNASPPSFLSGAGELPFRPAPGLGYQQPGQAGQAVVAQGIYYPPRALSQVMRKGEFSRVPFFSESDLAWNRGQSQDQTKELKEFYLDMEFFDSRLWVRAGKQNIVWGKTELFRTTDQFNPQDLALSSLPSLEESRIALWALRGVWSFYDVGPLQDVRLELAMNYDEFQPSDLGVCGEPYVIDLVCSGAFGLQAHGILGLGVAGVVVPEDPWEDTSGIEVGGRLEWRWNRFSFALTDFYGYGDFPTVEQISRYSRNVDPISGRPRRNSASAPCRTGTEASCLPVADTTGDGYPNEAVDTDGDGVPDTLTDHHANQQIFAWICGMTIGVTSLDPTACGNTIFNSFAPLGPLPGTVAEFSSALLAANSAAVGFAESPDAFGVRLPSVVPNRDPGDTRPGTGFFSTNPALPTMNRVLTTEQQALFGCGAFYATDCDVDGFDLLNAEASALFQAFAGFEGTESGSSTTGAFDWDATDPFVAQPGTEFFQGGPVATRPGGSGTVILPGAKGPGDPNYDPGVDGCVAPAGTFAGDGGCGASNGGLGANNLIHPFFDPAFATIIINPEALPANQVPIYRGVDGEAPCSTPSSTGVFCQRFANEMAAISWNLQALLVGFSSSTVVSAVGDSVFDPEQPFAEDRCSYASPHFCLGVAGFLDFTGVQRATVRAGGSDKYGRRDFVWQIGTPLKVEFQKRNVLGFSVDWAEDLTKSNWSFEATWIEGVPMFDNDNTELITDVDTYNLTMSVDRPTFINFLNQNRTFFVNSQWFLQYVDGYRKGFSGEGPWSLLGTFTVTTGYFQDRMLPGVTFVYDLRSNSGAVLPQVSYRFTENFSTTFG
ncbi:MAG: DUF1302 family protein, partial [Myxococcota bacterium]